MSVSIVMTWKLSVEELERREAVNCWSRTVDACRQARSTLLQDAQ